MDAKMRHEIAQEIRAELMPDTYFTRHLIEIGERLYNADGKLPKFSDAFSIWLNEYGFGVKGEADIPSVILWGAKMHFRCHFEKLVANG